MQAGLVQKALVKLNSITGWSIKIWSLEWGLYSPVLRTVIVTQNVDDVEAFIVHVTFVNRNMVGTSNNLLRLLGKIKQFICES